MSSRRFPLRARPITLTNSNNELYQSQHLRPLVRKTVRQYSLLSHSTRVISAFLQRRMAFQNSASSPGRRCSSDRIQFWYAATSVYTPGFRPPPQPSPQLTTPTSCHADHQPTRHTSGDPLSPVHASVPSPPAHTIPQRTRPAAYADSHSDRPTNDTRPSRSHSA